MVSVLKIIRSWFRISPTKHVQEAAFIRLKTVAPLKPEVIEASAGNLHVTSPFICREAILDRNERIGGYNFALGRKLKSRMLEKSVLIRRAYDDAMLLNLASLGMPSLLGDRFIFIRLSSDSLSNPLLKTFAHSNTFIMISPSSITGRDLVAMDHELQNLAELGLKHGWTIDRPHPELSELLHKSNLIEIDTTALDGIQLKMMYRDFRKSNEKLKIMASELQSSDDFNLCYHCGFDYFMGPFVTSREKWRPAKSEINRLLVFEVLNLIRDGAEFNTIASCLRKEPILTFKLLRYINSPAFGFHQNFNDISQALLILGKDKIYRWLSLLLFDFNQPGYQARVLIEQSLMRARFMELLAGHGHISAFADQLFITGLFSLLDSLMGQPLTEVLQQVSLPQAVVAALKSGPGNLYDALSLSVAIESTNPEEIAVAAAQCGLDASIVSELMIEALAWTQQIIATANNFDT